MTLSAQQRFFEHIVQAPHAARGFLETDYEHFRPRNDVEVRFSHTVTSDMRLRSHCLSRDEKEEKQILAHWHGAAVSVHCQLLPEELMCLVFFGGGEESQPPPQNPKSLKSGWAKVSGAIA
ncbi:hypothetical protein ACS3QZ_14205 [Shimia sp. W99]